MCAVLGCVEPELVGLMERPNTGRHEKAPVRCTCNRLAALHGDPRTLTRHRNIKAFKHVNTLRVNTLILSIPFSSQCLSDISSGFLESKRELKRLRLLSMTCNVNQLTVSHTHRTVFVHTLRP